MATNFPMYSHPLRAKVIMAKGVKGDTPTASVTKDEEGIITIEVTNQNDGHPETETVTMQVPVATVTKTGHTATVTIKDDDGTTTTTLEDGLSIASAAIDDNYRLIITMSNGSTVDAGEIPVSAFAVADTIALDGTTTTYTMTADISQDDVAYVLINGLVYTSGYTISNTTPRTITLSVSPVPSGTLEIIQNTSGYVSERMDPMTSGEIIDIFDESE